MVRLILLFFRLTDPMDYYLFGFLLTYTCLFVHVLRVFPIQNPSVLVSIF